MTRFEYVIPGETTVKRLFKHALMTHDLFAILVDGETVATVNFETAQSYWQGKKTLEQIAGAAALRRQNDQGEGVK